MVASPTTSTSPRRWRIASPSSAQGFRGDGTRRSGRLHPVFVLPAIVGAPIDGASGRCAEAAVCSLARLLRCGLPLVSEAGARTHIRRVLDQLARRPEEELRAKRRRLREVRDAFVFREGSSAPGAKPSATEFILAEVKHPGPKTVAVLSARLAPSFSIDLLL